MIDDPSLQRKILGFLAQSEESTVEISLIQSSACPDSELIQVTQQIHLLLRMGFLDARADPNTGKKVTLFYGGDGLLVSPVVTGEGREFLDNKFIYRALKNAPNFLALAHLGRIAIYVAVLVVLVLLFLFARQESS